MNYKNLIRISAKILLLFFSILLLCHSATAQVVVLQQGFDSTSGSTPNGTWTNADQIQNGGNTWISYGQGNDVIEGNYSCSGWTTCNDKTGNKYGITGGAPNFKGTGSNIGYIRGNSTDFAIFDDYDAIDGSYGGIYTPTFNLLPYSNATLTFYWNNANTSASYIEVQYWNGSVWTGTTNFAQGTGVLGWHEATLPLPANATQLAFYIIADSAINPVAIGLDQIEIYATSNNCGDLTATISSSTNIQCNGQSTGTATVTASGGATPYTYSWAPSGGTNATASNLSAGIYTVTVSVPEGCSHTAIVSITQPPVISWNISSLSNGICGGGSAVITVNGGTPPYTYLWSPGGATTASVNNLFSGTYTVTITDHNGCIASTTTTILGPPSITATIVSSTNVSCYGGNNGSAILTASGGTAPYTYSWAPSGGRNAAASNLSAGTYTVTINDPGSCENAITVIITQPPAISAQITSTPVTSCSNNTNGTAIVSVSGGTSPYTYSWLPSAGLTGASSAAAGNMAKGTYTCTVTDANGCIENSTVTIGGPIAITGSISAQTNPSCYGLNTGSVTISVSGGTSPYTYSWSPNGGTNATASNLIAGSYTCTITDANGCTGTVMATITQPSQVRDSISSYSNILCYGGLGSANVGVKGGTTPYTYIWSPNVSSSATASNLSAGSYTISVIANGCPVGLGYDPIVTITQPLQLVSSIVSTNNLCNGTKTGSATVSVSGGTIPYTYTWSPSGGTNATASNLSAGTYSVIIMDHNSCNITATVNITQPAAISVTASGTNATCIANNGSASITSTTGGTSPYAYKWSNGATTTSISNLSAGTYTVTVTDDNGCTGSTDASILSTGGASVVVSSLTNILCNGFNTGSATVAASGGVSPYTYKWSNGATTATASNLSAGTYTVTVTDLPGCSTNALITISEPSAIVIVPSSSPATCSNNGGSAGVAVSGGTAPYSYTWSNGATTSAISNLSAGTYSITVTDKNSCSATSAIVVHPGSGITATTSHTTETCRDKNGSASVVASGGTSPYTYAWSTSPLQTTSTATGLGAGTYTCVITDKNGCSYTATVNVISTAETVSVISATNDLCNGGKSGSISISVTGGTRPYTYTWAPVGGTTATASNLSAGNYTVTVKDSTGCTITAQATVTQPVLLRDSLITSALKNVSCSGDSNGSIAVGVKGGITPYTYTWMPNVSSNSAASNLKAGTYNITVGDANGCSASTLVVKITQPSLLKDSVAAITNVIGCNGGNNGSATIGVVGGTPPYTYVWTPNVSSGATASNLSAGTYAITVTDKNGCSAVTKATITQPALLVSHIVSTTNDLCHGSRTGNATVGVSGGTPPYTYEWLPGRETTATASNLAAGSYTVIVKDKNGCTTQSTVTITQPAEIRDSIVSQVNVNCNGNNTGSIVIGVKDGIPPYTYTWTPNVSTTDSASNLPAGYYRITVTDSNGCSVHRIIAEITEPLQLEAIITRTTCTRTNTGSATVLAIGGETPYTYLWTPSGESSATATGLIPGTYTVTVTDKNNCDVKVNATIYNCRNFPSDNTPANTSTNGVTPYPNPTLGNFTIQGVTQGQVVVLYNYMGQELSRATVENDTNMQFDISNRPNGIYLIRIENADGTLASENKIVKMQ